MNKLPLAKRVQILSMLCEGSSMRSISRVADVSINTVTKLLVEAGETCLALHDELVRDVKAKRVQADEIWTFVSKKDKHVRVDDPEEFGNQWAFIALDAETKLIVSCVIGKRTSETTRYFLADLKSRIASASFSGGKCDAMRGNIPLAPRPARMETAPSSMHIQSIEFESS